MNNPGLIFEVNHCNTKHDGDFLIKRYSTPLFAFYYVFNHGTRCQCDTGLPGQWDIEYRCNLMLLSWARHHQTNENHFILRNNGKESYVYFCAAVYCLDRNRYTNTLRPTLGADKIEHNVQSRQPGDNKSEGCWNDLIVQLRRVRENIWYTQTEHLYSWWFRFQDIRNCNFPFVGRRLQKISTVMSKSSDIFFFLSMALHPAL